MTHIPYITEVLVCFLTKTQASRHMGYSWSLQYDETNPEK